MAYNPYLYSQFYNAPYPYQPPTAPSYTPPYSTQTQPAPMPQQQPGPAPQAMTPPTVHAEIIQVKSVEEVDGFPVNVGTTQMFQLADDSAILTKTVYANGQYNVDIYAKQAKKPVAPLFDPSAFVTRDELEERLAGLTRFRRKRDEAEQDAKEVPNGELV